MNYPKNLLKPIFEYLKKLESDLLRRKGELKKEDPFRDISRLNDNASDDTEAAEQFGHAQVEAMSSETEDALKRVRNAMTRVEKGSYGKCVECKKMIDTDRLGIDPTAEKCVKCAKKNK
ncbi:MAG: TraR/DksA C4-type zinc finger protein [bacterium]